MAAIAVKERPILFSSPMVRALLDGRKTQTRRVADIRWDTSRYWGDYDCWTFYKSKNHYIGFTTGNGGQAAVVPHCPKGSPGDRLWVRETWKVRGLLWNHCAADVAKYASAKAIIYRADEPDRLPHVRWRPSIFMPRALSRLTLEITEVRVERLQDISEADKAAEGATEDIPFGTVWRKINTKPGIRWEDNPWVWALTFKLVPASA